MYFAYLKKMFFLNTFLSTQDMRFFFLMQEDCANLSMRAVTPMDRWKTKRTPGATKGETRRARKKRFRSVESLWSPVSGSKNARLLVSWISFCNTWDGSVYNCSLRGEMHRPCSWHVEMYCTLLKYKFILDTFHHCEMCGDFFSMQKERTHLSKRAMIHKMRRGRANKKRGKNCNPVSQSTWCS